MTYKQIEAAREARLWLGQIILPAAGIVVGALNIPEVRQAIANKTAKAKKTIEFKLNKKDEAQV